MHCQRSSVLNRPRTSHLLALALLAATAVLVADPSSAQDSADPSPVLIVDPAAAISFNGRGWGHGVGMSQWGARARSEAGHSAAEILGFYYEGANLVENYGRPDPAPSTSPNPAQTPGAEAIPTTADDSPRVLLATTGSTVLTPEGLNRITVENQNIPVGSEDAARPPAGTPVSFSRHQDRWHISYNGADLCPGGCAGQTAQLHFATGTAVAVSSTGRSYSHGRINLVAVAGDPSRFHITVDSLTIAKFLDDPHNHPGGSQGAAEPAEGSVQILLATAQATTLTPEGLNRITVDDADIPHAGQGLVRAPAGSPIAVTRVDGLWRIQFGSADVCGSGCAGETAQLHFATGTSVAVSTTGRSYSHGRINLVAVAGDPSRFHITVDSLTIAEFLDDPHGALPAAAPGLPTTPAPAVPPAPAHAEDSIGIHLSTTTSTTLIPQGANRITIDGQGEIRVAPGTPVTFVRHVGHWHVRYNGADACGSGCAGRTAQLHFATGTSVRVSNTGRSYSHGRINLVPTGGDPGQFYVIVDSLPMERYLRGIAETPMDWPLAAHQAQAIAARSYATATLRERRASDSWGRPFDLYASTWDQAYAGDTREKHADAATWLQAVESTAGQVLFHGGAPIRAFYSSSNGGQTERSGYVFATDLPYLSAKPDPLDAHQDNPNASWSRSYTAAEFNGWLNDHPDTAVGHLIGMAVDGGAGASGRLDKARIRITGTSRTVTVTGSRLQARIHTAARESGRPVLLSTLFSFTVPAASVAWSPGGAIEPPVPADAPDDARLYSGVIDGPDFCLNSSLGGPATYPLDNDKDGVADVCSLRSTRRVAVAHQKTIEELAFLEQAIFIARFAEECRSVPDTFGEPDKEAEDECQQYRDFPVNSPGGSASPNGAAGAQTSRADAGEDHYVEDERLFFSGIINGRDFCVNFSLGGPITYAYDSDLDGVADICALPRTRRAAVARQRALEHLATASEKLEALYQPLFMLNCRSGLATLGEAAKEAEDACEPHIRSGAI